MAEKQINNINKTIIMENQLELINPTQFGIEESKAKELIGNLPQIKAERDILQCQYNEVILLDIEDLNSAKKARELRLLIQKNRTQGINVWHKNTKDFFLKGGQFVDAIKRMESAINEGMESKLEEIEKYAETQELLRIEKLRTERKDSLIDFIEFIPSSIDLGIISEDEYKNVLNGAKLQFEAKKEHERLAELSRIEKEEAERLEQIRIREENERLRKEKEEQRLAYEAEQKNREEEHAKKMAKELELRKQAEEKAAKEKAEIDAKLRKEKEERDRIEAELKAKKDAEEKAEKEILRLEEEKRKEQEKLLKAPIKEQMNHWVNSFIISESPVENEKSKAIIQKFEAFKKWAKSEIESL